MTARLYRACLVVLPGWFREEFAGEMTAVFEDSLADARRDGAMAVLALWIRTAGDLLGLGWRLHVEALRRDVSYATRTLRRTSAFTLAAIATLALGMGPALVIANLMQRVVLQPLPFAESDRLVSVWNVQPDRTRHGRPSPRSR